jgi:phosphopantothenoylcysteine synthetase/decarboxylase
MDTSYSGKNHRCALKISNQTYAMKAIVTCGPAITPIDCVRCITNFSTGELGILLANHLARQGFEVICLKGSRATCPLPLDHVETRFFETNEDLLEILEHLASPEIAAVFHTAALSDFRVRSVVSAEGVVGEAQKIPSSVGELQLTLESAPKLLPKLRALFPKAKIVGWKYELDGTREEALEKGFLQIRENFTDASIVNGSAYGSGFGFCETGTTPLHLADKTTLCTKLAAWLRAKVD